MRDEDKSRRRQGTGGRSVARAECTQRLVDTPGARDAAKSRTSCRKEARPEWLLCEGGAGAGARGVETPQIRTLEARAPGERR
jgi:hypothetical protein